MNFSNGYNQQQMPNYAPPTYQVYQQPAQNYPQPNASAWGMPQTVSQGNMGQQPSRQYLSGKAINSLNDVIVPQEVPDDGSTALFPLVDRSCIYAMAWSKSGKIDTVRYVLEQPSTNDQNEQKPNEFSMIMERLDRIENAVNPPKESKLDQNNSNNNQKKG